MTQCREKKLPAKGVYCPDDWDKGEGNQKIEIIKIYKKRLHLAKLNFFNQKKDKNNTYKEFA
jgi:hypothetical protein